jgi:hypothetical protein
VDTITSARLDLDACRQAKGGLDNCKTEYEKARQFCEADPADPACDASVCFDTVGKFSLTNFNSCASYVDDSLIKRHCGTDAACVQKELLKQKACAENPALAQCKVNIERKLALQRHECGFRPERPYCGSLGAGCRKDPRLEFCNEILEGCKVRPDVPACKPVAPATGAPTLKAPDATQDPQQGEQDTGAEEAPQEGAGPNGGEGSGGGQEPQQTEPEQPGQGQEPGGQ